MKLEIFPYYFVITKMLNLSNEKWKLVYLDQYEPTKIPKALWDNDIHTLQYVEKTQLRSAKRWQCITRLINKSETTVMVSCLIPHRSSNILLCSYFSPSSVNSSTCSYTCPSSVDSFTVFSFPSASSVDSSYNPFTYEFSSA